MKVNRKELAKLSLSDLNDIHEIAFQRLCPPNCENKEYWEAIHQFLSHEIVKRIKTVFVMEATN